MEKLEVVRQTPDDSDTVTLYIDPLGRNPGVWVRRVQLKDNDIRIDTISFDLQEAKKLATLLERSLEKINSIQEEKTRRDEEEARIAAELRERPREPRQDF